jgi:hypothetical protein
MFRRKEPQMPACDICGKRIDEKSMLWLGNLDGRYRLCAAHPDCRHSPRFTDLTPAQIAVQDQWLAAQEAQS